MKITKSFTAIILALGLVLSMTISIRAESIEKTSKALTIGKTYTLDLKASEKAYDYKIVVPKDGTLSLSFETWVEHLGFLMYDDLGNEVKTTKTNTTMGEFKRDIYINSALEKAVTGGYYGLYINFLYWNSTKEQSKGVADFKCAKGTYYIRMARNATGMATVKFGISLKDLKGKALNQDGTLKDSSKSETNSTPIFIVTINKGEKLQLGLDTTSKNTITYKSNNKEIATISSKGVVKGVKNGTVNITATIDEMIIEMKIKVIDN